MQELWGVGPRLAERLRSMGLVAIGALARCPLGDLEQAFGVVGAHLHEAAWGRDASPIVPYHQGVDPKSMGHEVTLPEDCRDPEFLEGTLLRLSDQVARRLRGDGYLARTIVVKLRDQRFRTITRQRALATGVDDHRSLFEVACGLWRENWNGSPLRLLGVSASALEKQGEAEQIELFREGDRQKRLQGALDRLRDKLGEASVVPAGSLTHRRELGHVPFGATPRHTPPGPALSREGAATEMKRKLRQSRETP